ncbi:unnamed protein product [Polarella glacialis]|uniref:Uncharacterized protein n=1 Tax=Polarella glacialis TaxID=89957 RepID=A0A813FXC5_POLGL|nr:unnamed protein product [Polarella glacialis]
MKVLSGSLDLLIASAVRLFVPRLALRPSRARVQMLRTPLLLIVLLLSFVTSADAYGGKKKSKFMAAYPFLFKFFLFWWCVFVFGVMFVYISDHLMFRKFGPAKVRWSAEHVFKGSASRETYWSQVADPSKWSMQHPILQTADIRMVKCTAPEKKPEKPEKKEETTEEEEEAKVETVEGEPLAKLEPIPMGPLKAGLGMIFRHKADSEVRAGSFFCTRECSELEAPSSGPWRLVMRTVETGAGYPFLANTEVSQVEMWPAAEDGSIRCKLTGSADLTSRVFRWWAGLQSGSMKSAEMYLQSVEELVGASKKKD